MLKRALETSRRAGLETTDRAWSRWFQEILRLKLTPTLTSQNYQISQMHSINHLSPKDMQIKCSTTEIKSTQTLQKSTFNTHTNETTLVLRTPLLCTTKRLTLSRMKTTTKLNSSKELLQTSTVLKTNRSSTMLTSSETNNLYILIPSTTLL